MIHVSLINLGCSIRYHFRHKELFDEIWLRITFHLSINAPSMARIPNVGEIFNLQMQRVLK